MPTDKTTTTVEYGQKYQVVVYFRDREQPSTFGVFHDLESAVKGLTAVMARQDVVSATITQSS